MDARRRGRTRPTAGRRGVAATAGTRTGPTDAPSPSGRGCRPDTPTTSPPERAGARDVLGRRLPRPGPTVIAPHYLSGRARSVNDTVAWRAVLRSAASPRRPPCRSLGDADRGVEEPG